MSTTPSTASTPIQRLPLISTFHAVFLFLLLFVSFSVFVLISLFLGDPRLYLPVILTGHASLDSISLHSPLHSLPSHPIAPTDHPLILDAPPPIQRRPRLRPSYPPYRDKELIGNPSTN